MNSNGDIYDGPKRSPEDVEVPAESVPGLRSMNRAARRAYFSEKRRGKSEADCLEAARAACRR